MGLIIVVLVGGLIGIGVIAALVGAFSIRRPRLGHATLNCPHCGAETRAQGQKCSACHADL
jgi:hypothetical protein